MPGMEKIATGIYSYAEKYDFAGKTVRKLGISFSSEKRTIVEVKTA